jgi:hypothetical protein
MSACSHRMEPPNPPPPPGGVLRLPPLPRRGHHSGQPGQDPPVLGLDTFIDRRTSEDFRADYQTRCSLEKSSLLTVLPVTAQS